MGANPVQIVLNSQNYLQKAQVLPGGSNKDFFAARDAEFVAHQKRLFNEVTSLAAQLPVVGGSLQYAHIELDESAWAKSHRPTKSVFPSNKIRTIGGNSLGTLVVEITAGELRELPQKILAAESETRWVENKKTHKIEAKPSRLKSEVGAIRRIRLYGAQDRRKFTIEQAVSWLSDPRTGGVYYVETFISQKNVAEELSEREKVAQALLKDFQHGVRSLNIALEISTATTAWSEGTIFIVKIQEKFSDPSRKHAVHLSLVNFLDHHAAVRSILLPPILQSSSAGGVVAEAVELQPPPQEDSYPVVGVIDTGISFAGGLDSWSAGGIEFIDGASQDRSHGTFIAGLLSGGALLNAGNVFAELPCKFYDVGLHPTSDYDAYFPRGFIDFLEQLDIEIVAAKKSGVRVFNMSLSVTLPVDDSNYSLFANALDQLADKHDVLFVLPSGNLDSSTFRDEWPKNPDDCLKMLAEYGHQGKDRIYQPADSLRSLVVGAIDPPDFEGTMRPSRYTRRGPGPSLGAKPDLAHVGGAAGPKAGLVSISPDGKLIANCGTSFASPLAAKTLAVLNHAIEGHVSLETLSALAIHNAVMPNKLKHKKLSNIARHFVGAGVPQVAANTLVGDDHEITLVFSGVLSRGQELAFNFAWPASLVSAAGVCRGKVKLTLVYRPPIDRQFGAEFVLVNLDSWLRQEIIDLETGEVTYKSRLKSHTDHGIEKERVAHGAKWWPVKQFEQAFPKGVGNSSQWRLVIESLCRSDYVIDENGIPFSVVMTISDLDGEQHIFNEVRRQLTASGVQIADVQVALSNKLRPR